MKLVLVRHLWGVDLSEGYAKHSKHWHEIGYTALEGSSRFVPDVDLLHRAIRDEGFQWIPQVFSNMQEGGGTVKQHLDSLREQIEECLNYKPLFFNGHTGADHWTLSEAEDFYHAVNEMECEYSVSVSHETHRSRYLGNPWSACRLLEIIPTLKLTCDFSHWVCVAERLLADAKSVIEKAVSCCHHIHARVGYEQGPQVPDPRDPVWANHLQVHERWWEMAWMAALNRNLDRLTLTPEFGPPPYLHTLPFSGKPISNLEEICDWMAVRQSRHFALWDKNATHRSDPGRAKDGSDDDGRQPGF